MPLLRKPTATAQVQEITDPQVWDDLVTQHGGHPLQLWGWGEVKATGEWTPRRLLVEGEHGSGVAQVLVRRLPAPFRALSYVPRGPAVGSDGVGNDAARVEVMQAIVAWCRKNVGGVAVEFEPDWPEGTELTGLKWVRSTNTILYPHTLIIDLTQGPEALMKVMQKSTRYDIRKSLRDGLEVRRVTDPEEVYQVLDVFRETSKRAGFALHSDEYHLAIHNLMGENSRLVAAFDETGKPCAFAWSIVSDKTGFMLYGGRNSKGQQLRANPATYWGAFMDALEFGCERYDLNGLFGEGITTFKKSFAKHDNMQIGTLAVPTSPLLYQLWEQVLPVGKRVMRAIRTRNLAELYLPKLAFPNLAKTPPVQITARAVKAFKEAAAADVTGRDDTSGISGGSSE